MFKSFINSENILKIKNGIPFVVKKTGLPLVNWEQALDLLDYDINNNPDSVRRYGEHGFMLLNAERIQLVDLFVKELYSIFEKSLEFSPDFFDPINPSSEHHIYLSLTTDSKSYGGRHFDYSNVVFLQLNGKSRWKIYRENSSDLELDDILNPGDIVYCPSKRHHEVIAITPRFGVSLGFDKLKAGI
jgi:hypothetical protein